MAITINGTTGLAGVGGSAGTPAIQGGDTNTGMFFPAADTIAFATAGTEDMRIDANGLIGVKGAASLDWTSTYQVIQYNAGPALWSANNTNVNLSSNIYSDGTIRYLTTAGAGYVNVSTGGVTLNSFSSGTAGGAVTVGAIFSISQTNCLMTTANGGLGYGSGAGGTVTQATSKSTAVTLNKPTGQITTNNAALGATTSINFLVNNSLVAAVDTIIVNPNLPADPFAYTCQVGYILAGGFYITVRNNTGASRSEALVINFAIIKGATS